MTLAPITVEASKLTALHNENLTGIKYYCEDPYYEYGDYDRYIGTTTAVADQAFYNQNMVWVGTNTSSFPDHLASGFYDDPGTFTALYCLQSQQIIDTLIDDIMDKIGSQTDSSQNYICTGINFDTPRLWGTFNYYSSGNVITSLNYWNGTDSCSSNHVSVMGVTHNYATYSDGKAQFVLQLKQRIIDEYGMCKIVGGPWLIYGTDTANKDEWINQASQRSDWEETQLDLILSETSANNTFYDDYPLISSVVVPMPRNILGSCEVQNYANYTKQRRTAALCAITGGWYQIPMHFGDAANSIVDLPPRQKMVRLLPGWCNLSDVGTSNCTWDGNTFSATKASIAGDMPFAWIGTSTMWVHKWGSSRGYPFGVNETSDLYVVKHGTGTENLEPLQIDPDRIVYQVKRLNGYMEEDVDGKADWRRDGASGNYYLNTGLLTGTATDGGLPYKFKIAKPGMALKAYSED